MTDVALDAAAKKTLLRKIPHGVFICGVAEGERIEAAWVEGLHVPILWSGSSVSRVGATTSFRFPPFPWL